MSIRSRQDSTLARYADLFVTAGGVCVAVALNAIATRGERVVHWDAFQYISLARELSAALPDHLGGHYPFGYPLLAAPAVAMGAHPYLPLLCVSLFAYGVLLYALSKALGGQTSTQGLRAFVPSLSLVPLVFLLALDAMSEMTFVCLLVLAATMMTSWSRPVWIYATVPVIVGAFAVRYAGVFLLPAAIGWLLYDRLTARSISVMHASLGIGVATISVATLLYSNLSATGFVSGGPMVPGDHSFGGVLRHISDFGSGAIGIFSEGMFVRLSANANMQFAVGMLCAISILGLAIAALGVRKGNLCAVAGVMTLSYTGTIVLLQSITDFADPSRYLIPTVPFLFLIIVILLSDHRRVIISIIACVGLIGGIVAVRGVNAERNVDITSASEFLQPRMGPGTRVFVNFDAMSLAARLNGVIWVAIIGYDPAQGYVFMVDPAKLDTHEGDYLAIATVGYERQPGRRVFPNYWVSFLRSLLRGGLAKIVYQNQNVIIARVHHQGGTR